MTADILTKPKLIFREHGFTLQANCPAQYSDLNIIRTLWSVLEKNVCKRHSETLEELWNYAQEFEKNPVDYVKLYDYFPQRLQLNVAKKVIRRNIRLL